MQWHYNNDDNAHYATGITGRLRVTYAIEAWDWEVELYAVDDDAVIRGSAPTMAAAQAAAIQADREHARELRESPA